MRALLAAAVGAAEERLRTGIRAAMVVDLVLAAVIFAALRLVHLRVVQPINRLAATAVRLARGDYAARTGLAAERLGEVAALAGHDGPHGRVDRARPRGARARSTSWRPRASRPRRRRAPSRCSWPT
ncbi:MAG: HAMP domain-containing protein [Rubrivivax sp.]